MAKKSAAKKSAAKKAAAKGKVKTFEKAGKACPPALSCPTPMAVASLATRQAKTCEDKQKAAALWYTAASHAVATDPTGARAQHIGRIFFRKVESIKKFCDTSAARAAERKVTAEKAFAKKAAAAAEAAMTPWEKMAVAAQIEQDRERLVGGMNGLGRFRSRSRSRARSSRW